MPKAPSAFRLVHRQHAECVECDELIERAKAYLDEHPEQPPGVSWAKNSTEGGDPRHHVHVERI